MPTYFMKKLLHLFLGIILYSSTMLAQQKGLIISEFLTNPSGSDSPYEYVELVATTAINFSSTPYTIVFTDNGTASINGWKVGGNVSYAFEINTGAVTAGQVVYVGGSYMAPLYNGGIVLRKINTGTTNGDYFGFKYSGGVLGQGGIKCDGIAVFNMGASAITASTVPVDAIFFGTSYGTAIAGINKGYQLPINDKYNGGKLVSTSYLAPDPLTNELVRASSGTYDPASQSFSVARTWTKTTIPSYNSSSVKVLVPKGLIISEFLTNPLGNDSPFEYLELLATTSINFAFTPYTVVFSDNGTASTSGWKAGGTLTYSFQINTGSVTAGQVVYVGGSSMAPISIGGVALRKINTGTTNGDVFGSGLSSGVLGQGGVNCDGIAVFNTNASNITSATVPVDAIFFGTGYGTAIAGANQGYQMPVNDKYNGGKLVNTSFLAPDPLSGEIIKATSGIYDPSTKTFTVSRSWSKTSTPSYNVSSVTLIGTPGNNAPTIAFNPTASKLINEASGKISCVMNNSTDPVIVSGLDVTIMDENLSTVTFQMISSNTTVVPNSNLVVTGSGSSRKCKITPIASGYSLITIKIVDAGGLSNQISFNLAVSASIVNASSSDIYHTGSCDGSTAVPIDANYMFVADDEDNLIRLYSRNASGLPVYKFDVSSYLNLTGLEVDIEGSFRSRTKPNRIYWIGSLSNSKTGALCPDRNRIFATDIVGTGANATLTFVGYYGNLRSKLITWGDANGYNFSASAASGIEPKRIDGFNIEGLEMGPDGTTMYIAFRAPYVPAGTQNKALICPLLNFETWFNNGSPAGSPVLGAPIALNLSAHGIRSIGKNALNQYLIVAGSYAATGTYKLYSWNGYPNSPPVALTCDLTGLHPEGIVDVPASLSGTFNVQLMSDIGGSFTPYNDGILDKDLVEPNYRKFLTSTISVVNSSRALFLPGNQEEEPTASLKLYPNPVNSFISVEFGEGEITSSKFSVYNAMGSLVKEIISEPINGISMLDLSELENGYYFILVDGRKKAFKIVKQF
jgi:hypothetical protein